MKTFGGGEMVSMMIAESLSKQYHVDVLSPMAVDKKKVENFFGVNLSSVTFKDLGFIGKMTLSIPTMKTYKYSIYTRLLSRYAGLYDLIIDTGTNGLFSSDLPCKTMCYVHFPGGFTKKKKGLKGIFNHLIIDPKDIFRYDLAIANSRFTSKAIKKYSDKVEVAIINPPVMTSSIKSSKSKKNYILNIGRFSPEKKQGVLIDAFKEINANDWELHLIGQFQPSYRREYYDSLKKAAKGYPIIFHENMPHDKLLKFISSCSIYWHSRGYGETDLMAMENFGISTVEAMAAGCVPIVIDKGAQPEIVDNGISGFIWSTKDQLKKQTLKVISDNVLADDIRKRAIEKSKSYSSERFRKVFLSQVKRLITS